MIGTLDILRGQLLRSVVAADNVVTFTTLVDRYEMRSADLCCGQVSLERIDGDLSSLANGIVKDASSRFAYAGGGKLFYEFDIMTDSGARVAFIWRGCESEGVEVTRVDA